MNKKIGRNDLCPCGSGKKYKNVVLTKIQIQTWVRTQPWIIRIKVRTPDSNLEFSQWTQLFENEMLLAALIDRVTFRSFVLNMNCSSSYRIDSTLNHDQWLKIFLSQLAHFFISEVAQFFIDKAPIISCNIKKDVIDLYVISISFLILLIIKQNNKLLGIFTYSSL